MSLERRRFSLPAKPVWTAFYSVASLLNLACLRNLAAPPLALFLLQVLSLLWLTNPGRFCTGRRPTRKSTQTV